MISTLGIHTTTITIVTLTTMITSILYQYYYICHEYLPKKVLRTLREIFVV